MRRFETSEKLICFVWIFIQIIYLNFNKPYTNYVDVPEQKIISDF